MKIGGFDKFSLVDFPGKISAIIFTQGCNFRCPFCHNGHLLPMTSKNNLISEKEILSFLKTRKNKLDGIVITGGEPTLQKDLKLFIKVIKSEGFKIKLDTNGSNPEVLQTLLKSQLLDYIAMDVKAPWEKYNLLTGVKVNIENLKKSISIIANSGINHEFRTTFVEPLLDEDDKVKILEMIPLNSFHHFQKFNPENALDPSLFNQNKRGE